MSSHLSPFAKLLPQLSTSLETVGTLLGDIELIRNRPKYMETTVCTGVVTACVISAKNFEKLILRVPPKLGSCSSLYESVKDRCAQGSGIPLQVGLATV